MLFKGAECTQAMRKKVCQTVITGFKLTQAHIVVYITERLYQNPWRIKEGTVLETISNYIFVNHLVISGYLGCKRKQERCWVIICDGVLKIGTDEIPLSIHKYYVSS